jgi:hypothetical protein
MAPLPVTSFLSITPLEPVLVFASEKDAHDFRANCNLARILHRRQPTWVYVPLPRDLERVYTAMRGDVCYEFHNHGAAKTFNTDIEDVGTIYNDRNTKVYLANIGEERW